MQYLLLQYSQPLQQLELIRNTKISELDLLYKNEMSSLSVTKSDNTQK
jgi:hypothetical protein